MPNGLILCLVSLTACALAARRSIGAGVSVLWIIGCFYGIVRANMLDGFTHFIFDAGAMGFYAVEFSKPVSPRVEGVSRDARAWLTALIGWPLLLFFLPINHYLVQLVGLRHIVLFLPAILVGARIRVRDLQSIATTVAVLNVIAFGVAVAEYFYGIEPFFPHNSVTEIMYHSFDIKTADGVFHRIPSIFTSAHAYAGTTLLTLPLIVNGVADESLTLNRRMAMGAVCVITILGIFIAGPRLPVAELLGAAALMLLLPGLKSSTKAMLATGMLIVGLMCAYYILSDQRMQRFTSLADTEKVEERAQGSLQFSLIESFINYPIGAGLGGVVGSSLPFFLKALAPEKMVGAENEYARIAAEQGLVGFLIWGALIFRILMRRPKALNSRWRMGTHAMWAIVCVNWAVAFIGTGSLQGIPGSFLMLMQMGILLRRGKERPEGVAVIDAQPTDRRVPASRIPVSNPVVPATRRNIGNGE